MGKERKEMPLERKAGVRSSRALWAMIRFQIVLYTQNLLLLLIYK